MTDTTQEQERVGGWNTTEWTPHELMGVLKCHEPGQHPYHAAREEILARLEMLDRLRARQREEGNATLADMLERFVEVDANGDKLGWMTSGYNLTCWEAMLEAARRLQTRQKEGP